MDVVHLRVSDEDIVALDIDERVLQSHQSTSASTPTTQRRTQHTYLRQILITTLVIVVVHQVRFLHERPQPSPLKHLEEREGVGEFLLPHVEFDLKLTEWQGLAGVDVGA